ncbi:MAG: hypothetical protein Q9207_006440 [Kuettlingeria erythrocarpa]
MKTLLILGVGVTLAQAESLCPLPSTVTVTVTPPITETFVNAASPSAIAPSSSLKSLESYGGLARGTSLGATTTLSSTTFTTSTKVLGPDEDPISAQSDAAEPGYYYYVDPDGTTTWLGSKTPTSGVFVTSTAVVTVQPQPSVTTETTTLVTTSQPTTSTSFTTLSTTSFSTYYHTKEVTIDTAGTPVPSAGQSYYQASYGWNATLSKSQTTKTSAPVIPPSDISTQGHGLGSVASTASYVIKRRHPRQIGAVVSATINGVLVSWTNSYSGELATSEPVSSVPVSSSTLTPTTPELAPLPEYSWNPSPAFSSSPAAPAQTLVTQTPSLPQPTGKATSTKAASASSAVSASTSQQSSALPTDGGLPTQTSTDSQSISLLPSSEVSLTRLPSPTSSSVVSLVKPTPPFSNSTQTSAASATEPSPSCGSDTGLFTINFDDLPHFSTESPLSDTPPIFNPYRKLFFNGGYGYVPPPEDPYAPISPPQLAVYNYHNDSQTSIDAGLELHGEIGAGPRVSENAYWIDAYSTWIGCANGGPSQCTIDFIGYDQFGASIAQQTLQQAACPGLTNCKLAQVKLTNQFRDLAGLQILAYVNETPVTFYMDDLVLGWSNNTCAAQYERASAA